MSETRKAYSCYTCSEEVTFHGTRVRYNLDGSLHLCKPEDKLAYEKYREYIRRGNPEWRLTGEDFWKWKREIYDFQRWTQSHDEQQAEAEAQERRKRAEAEAEARKAAEEAAETQRRKQASREKRNAAREKRKQERSNKGRKRSRNRVPHGSIWALRIMELTHDIFTLPFKEAEAVIKNKFRILALKFHPDRKGGDTIKFREMNEAYEYLMQRCTG